jgi:NhaP-type Na+/H+ or K+/H+ antiporter
VLFLPPLLFLDGWRIPREDLFKDGSTILELALGLVVFTVLGMGFFINWLIPAMPLAIAFPIGRSGFSNRSYRRIRNRAAHTHSKADDAHP